MDEAIMLDDLIHIPTHEEVFKAYWAGIKDLPSEGGEESPAKSTRRQRSQKSSPEPQQELEPKISGGRGLPCLLC